MKTELVQHALFKGRPLKDLTRNELWQVVEYMNARLRIPSSDLFLVTRNAKREDIYALVEKLDRSYRRQLGQEAL